MNSLKQKLIPLTLALCISACGGGGGGGSTTGTTTPTPTPTPTPTTTIDDEFGLYLADLSQQHILPGYALLQENAEKFSEAAITFCALEQPGSSELALLQLKWLEVNLQWQTMQWLKVGGVSKNNRGLRLQFWPDTQDAVGKGLDNLLNTQQTVDAAYVASQNVGGQGIPAAERLLFAEPELLEAENKAKRCEVLQAIAANIVNITQEIHQSWLPEGDDYATQLTSGSGAFSSRQDAIEELVTNWLEQLERVKDEKVLIPLGDASPGQLHRSELRFSHTSLAAIKLNLEIFSAIYTAAEGHGFDDILKDHLDQSVIEQNMKDNIANIQAKAAALQGTLEEVLQDDPSRVQVQELIAAIQDFRTILTADFIQALDISIGFNSNDGD